MAIFVQVLPGKEVFEKCINAIESVGIKSGELWLDSYLSEARTKNKLPNYINVLLHDYRVFREENIKWEYIVNYSDKAAWEYENSEGVHIIIQDNKFGYSEVIISNGLSEDLANKLNHLSNEQLYELIDTIIIPKYFKDSSIELRIIENNQ